MIRKTITTVVTSDKLLATLNKRTAQLLEAQTEIAKLQQRIIDLKKENQLLSWRLYGYEK